MDASKPLAYLLSFFYPNRCPFCGDVIKPREICCGVCRKKLKTDSRKYFIGNRWLSTSPFSYKSLPKDAVLRLKFNDCGQIAPAMSKYMADAVRENFSDYSFDAVTYVSMHRKRKNKSLFNHSKLLAKGIGKELNLPVKTLLVKLKYNKPQHRLESKERLKNVKNTFGVHKKSLDYLKGKIILLCDDVSTTGATLCECCKVLEKAGAKDIFCVTFAKA